MTLDILIATYSPDGIRRVAAMTLPVMDGVRYIVTWQRHEAAPVPPSLASRTDIEIHRVDSIGSSANHNEGISRSTAEWYLIADDDLHYSAEGLRALMQTAQASPELDLISVSHDGPDAVRCPDRPVDLGRPLPKDFHVACFDLAVHRTPRTATLRFDPAYGINAPLLRAGEDELFLFTALRRGLRCRFIPLTVCTHPGLTTGHRPPTPHILKAQGAIITLYYPLTAPLRIPLKAWRLWRAHGLSPLRSALHMIHGALYSTFILRTPWQK